MDNRAAALQGGDLGAALVPGDAAKSPLYRYVAGLDANIVMPPEGPKLSPDELAQIRRWIDAGAAWPAAQEHAGAGGSKQETWWAFRPLQRPVPPTLSKADAKLARNPIDAFIIAGLRGKELSPAPAATPATLVRRLYFDLIGLPPAPETMRSEAAALGAADAGAANAAYGRLVDRLLDSPHFGERWARHWLDVVRFGESHGYDKDKPRPNAWPYRDYVIRSFNADKPYGRFVQEQVAGDVLFPGDADGVVGLGFLASGPWDFIGHAELPETKIDGAIARHLDRDDMVSNVMGSFLGLTVHCAQCHDHKFDPISQAEYYGLQSVFAALDRTDRPYHRDPRAAAKAVELESRERLQRAEATRLDVEIARRCGAELKDLDAAIAVAQRAAEPRAKPQFGYHSGIERKADVVKWVQVDLGEPADIARIEIAGCHDDFAGIGAGFGFPVRYRVDASNDPAFVANVRNVVDRTAGDVANPGVELQAMRTGNLRARFVRVTATKLAKRSDDFIFALAELAVYDAAGKNRALGRPVAALDAVEFAPRWHKANLVDGYYFGAVDPQRQARVAQLKSQREELLARKCPKKLLIAVDDCDRQRKEIRRQLASLPAPEMVFAGGIHTGAPPFAGTGSTGGKPRPVHVLARGDVRRPLRPAVPGALACIGLPADFSSTTSAAEGQRRAALALWLTDCNNPLVWRVMANRLWQYHFGRGLVDTPNDFGRMGQAPSHPELLDWLAAELRDNGQSLKKLHRLIVLSNTYRQSSQHNARAAQVDSDNRLCWRANRRKLEAEAVRDSILAVAGKLDLAVGGPSFRDFVVEKPEHSPHYEYHLHDVDDPKSHRRSIYRFLVRSKPEPMMAALDCADPSLAVDKRNQSLAPQQALALLNGPLAATMARHFAARVQARATDAATQSRLAFELALSRPPDSTEHKSLKAFIANHGLPAACRALFNLNEFAFVD